MRESFWNKGEKMDAAVAPQSNANPQQLEAIIATDGPVLIIAGPGSGKTFTLVERLFATPLDSNAVGVAVSSFAFTPAINFSVPSPAIRIVSPGLVQNCPFAIRQLPVNSSTIFSPRSARAPGKITTGFRLDSSRYIGFPTASAVLGDVVDAAANLRKGTHASLGSFARATIRPIDETHTPVYVTHRSGL